MADDYICNVCHQKVKTKLKRAHETGAKHRANVQKLSAPKRPAPTQIENEPEPIVSKKGKQFNNLNLHTCFIFSTSRTRIHRISQRGCKKT